MSVELSAKRLEVLKEALPSISRMAALWNPASPVSHRQAAGEAARTLGVELRTIEVAAPDAIPGGFAAAVAGGAEGTGARLPERPGSANPVPFAPRTPSATGC